MKKPVNLYWKGVWMRQGSVSSWER